MNKRIFEILAGIDKAEDQSIYRKNNNIVSQYKVANKFFMFLYHNGFASLKKKFTSEEFEKNQEAKEKLQRFKELEFPDIKDILEIYESPIVINVAGKNFARFDWDFFMKLPRWNSLIKFSQRILDPSILFVDWINDKRLPDSNECKKRAGLEGITSHKAIEDAWDVLCEIRKGTNNYVKKV